MSKDRLIIFAKAPLPGHVKTRLCPPLTPVEAARLHAAFVEDALDTALSLGSCEVTLAYTPEGSLGHFREIVAGKTVGLYQQTGADLGERMHNALSAAFSAGSGTAVLIGTDIPTLTPGILREAFARLDGSDAVFAPTADGGYCLVGLKRPHERLFTGIAWSTTRVLEDTLEKARALGLSVHLLPRQRDVDTPSDLEALTGAKLAPATARALGAIRARIAAG